MPETVSPWSLLHLLGDAAASTTNNTNDDVTMLSTPLHTPLQVNVTALTTPPRNDSLRAPVENSSSKTSPSPAVLLGSDPAQPASLPVRQPSPTPLPPLVATMSTPAFPTRLFNVQITKKPQHKEEVRLEDGYQVQRFDVICLCRGKKDMLYHRHVGNNRFRLLVEMRVDRYKATETKEDKTRIIREIIDAVQSGGGRFLRREAAADKEQRNHNDTDVDHDDDEEGNVYYDIGYRKTLDKVGKAIRTVVKKRETKDEQEPPVNAPLITRTTSEVVHVPPPPPQVPNFCNYAGSPHVKRYHGTKRLHEDSHLDCADSLLTVNAASRHIRGSNILWGSNLRQQPRYPAGSNAALSRMHASPGSHEPFILCNSRAALQLYLAEQRFFREAAQINHRLQLQALSRKSFERARGESLRSAVATRGEGIGPILPPPSMPLIVPKEIPQIVAAKNQAISNQENKKQKVTNKQMVTAGLNKSHKQETADSIKTPTVWPYEFENQKNDWGAKVSRKQDMAGSIKTPTMQPNELESQQNDWGAKLEVTPTPPQTQSLEVPNLHDQLDDDDYNSDSSSFYPHESEVSTSLARTQSATDLDDDDDDEEEEEEEEDDGVDWNAQAAFMSPDPDEVQQEAEDDESDASSFYPHD